MPENPTVQEAPSSGEPHNYTDAHLLSMNAINMTAGHELAGELQENNNSVS